MPKIIKPAEFNFSVEDFLDACSPLELREVDLLIQSNRYKSKIATLPRVIVVDGNLLINKNLTSQP